MEFTHVVVQLGEEFDIVPGQGSFEADQKYAETIGHEIIVRCTSQGQAEVCLRVQKKHRPEPINP
jgi:hypothetical protein